MPSFFAGPSNVCKDPGRSRIWVGMRRSQSAQMRKPGPSHDYRAFGRRKTRVAAERAQERENRIFAIHGDGVLSPIIFLLVNLKLMLD